MHNTHWGHRRLHSQEPRETVTSRPAGTVQRRPETFTRHPNETHVALSIHFCLIYHYLARSANLPIGLCILPSVISSFFNMSKAISVST